MPTEKDILEFKDYVIKDMIEMYGINRTEAIRLIDRYNFDKMIKKAPEFVLHYNTEDWAEKIYKNSPLLTT